MSGDDRVIRFQPPPFRPHPLLKNGHLQTLAGAWFNRQLADSAHCTLQALRLPDGDQLILHDEAPERWTSGEPIALLVHGMCGCAASPYMVRIARRLRAAGLRTLRINLRGCGAGRGLAQHPYHAGRSDDLQAVAGFAQDTAPASPLVVAGFSLGGNIVLKWLGEDPQRLPHTLCRAAAVNPPVDLQACTHNIARAARGLYDRHFSRLLYEQMLTTPQWCVDNPLAKSGRRPRRIIDFDDQFTAPRAGYVDAADYYRQNSAAQFVPAIRVPTLILSARDDPMVPPHLLESLACPAEVSLHLSEGGGHLGYITQREHAADRRWLDAQVVAWLTGGLPGRPV